VLGLVAQGAWEAPLPHEPLLSGEVNPAVGAQEHEERVALLGSSTFAHGEEKAVSASEELPVLGVDGVNADRVAGLPDGHREFSGSMRCGPSQTSSCKRSAGGQGVLPSWDRLSGELEDRAAQGPHAKALPELAISRCGLPFSNRRTSAEIHQVAQIQRPTNSKARHVPDLVPSF
jgi:hypothetical protein